MAKNKHYLIYGDDVRAKLDDLDELTDDLDAVVEKQTKKVLKQRGKKIRKQKPVKTSSKNSESLEDIDNSSVQNYEPPEEEDDTDEMEPEDIKPKKKKPNIIIVIMILIVVAACGVIGWMSVSSYLNKSEATPSPTVKTDIFKDVTSTIEPTASADSASENDAGNSAQPTASADSGATGVTITKGLLPDVSAAADVTISDTLLYASSINTTISSYYESIIDTIENYTDGYNIESEMSKYSTMIDFDMQKMESQYKSIYSQFSGDSYYSTAYDRFKNLKDMTTGLNNSMNQNELNTAANNYIRNENSLSEKSRQALIEYLDANNIVYSADDESKIVYDELPEESADPQASPETQETQESQN